MCIYIYVDLRLKWCWNLLTEGARIEGLFQTITALCSKILQSFKGNAQSQATLSVRNIIFKIRLGDHRYWKIVCKKMPNPCPKCTLSALFCFNCCGIVFEQC